MLKITSTSTSPPVLSFGINSPTYIYAEIITSGSEAQKRVSKMTATAAIQEELLLRSKSTPRVRIRASIPGRSANESPDPLCEDINEPLTINSDGKAP